LVADRPGGWRLVGFMERFDAWAEREQITDDVRVLVLVWVQSRIDDPYQGVRREPGHPNLWFAQIRSTVYKDSVVTCSYWIEETTHTVRCYDFCTLSWPV
jgi:hypothetical protein